MFKAQVSVHPIGTLSGFQIFELRCTFTPIDDTTDQLPQIWKSILVKTGEDSYREIFHLQDSANESETARLEPARIVRIGTESVLATIDSDGGNGGGCFEGYWRFGTDGPQQLDFSPLTAAIEKRIPRRAIFWPSCWSLDLKHSELKSKVQKRDAKCHGCDFLGEVTAHFKLNGARVEATDIHFHSDPE